MNKKKQSGALTVEAAIVLPFYILVIVFVLNFMNIFYTQLAVQMGMNNAATVLAQYLYVADVTVGVKDTLTLNGETAQKATDVASALSDTTTNLKKVVNGFSGGIKLENLKTMVDDGENLSKSLKTLGEKASAIEGEDIVNVLVATGVEVGASGGLTYIVNNYLDEMKINRSLIDGDITVRAAIDGKHDCDIVLTAAYQYKDPMFSVFFDTIPMVQSVVVHPWIGGETQGLRQVH